MNAIEPMSQPVMAWGVLAMVIAGLLFSGMVAPAVWLSVRRPRERSHDKLGQRMMTGLVAVGGGLLALALGLWMVVRSTALPIVQEPVRQWAERNAAAGVDPFPGRAVLAGMRLYTPHEVDVWSQWEPGRLPTHWRTGETARNSPPEWASSAIPTHDLDAAVASSQWFATREEAEQQGTSRLARALYYRLPEQDRWVLRSPLSLIGDLSRSALAAPEGVLEVMRKDFGGGLTANMYRAHFRIEHCGRVASQVSPFWITQTRRERGQLLMGGLGLVTVVLAGAGWGLRRLEV